MHAFESALVAGPSARSLVFKPGPVLCGSETAEQLVFTKHHEPSVVKLDGVLFGAAYGA